VLYLSLEKKNVKSSQTLTSAKFQASAGNAGGE
jgi:hypothetical protein